MEVIDLINELTDRNISIFLDGSDLQISYDNDDEITPEILEKIKNNKQVLLNYLEKYSANNKFEEIKPVNKAGNYSVSDAQRRMWILSQFEKGSLAYNLPQAIELKDNYNIEKFKKAIHATIERHEILRTVFKEDENGEIRQWVLPVDKLGFEFDYQDFRKHKNPKAQAKKYVRSQNNIRFDLEKGPLLRASLIHLATNNYIFYYNMHHIISDGWSMNVLNRDVLTYYQAFVSGTEPQMPALRIQYKDYSEWQKSQLSKEDEVKYKDYWLHKLAGEIPLINLPTEKIRPRLKTYKGKTLQTYLGKPLTSQIKAFNKTHGGSLFMILLATWNALLYRYTDQEDIALGSPVAGRSHSDLENQIGLYVNTIVLRNKIESGQSFVDFYTNVKDSTLQAYNYQTYPFDRLVEDLELERDTSRSALFDVMLVLLNTGEGQDDTQVEINDDQRIQDLGEGFAKLDIEILFEEVGERLLLKVDYNTDVYQKNMIEGLIEHYKQIVESLLNNPHESIESVDFLLEKERKELLVTLNDTVAAYRKDKTIIDLFQSQVQRAPEEIALIDAAEEITYAELNERANRLAGYLKEKNTINPNDIIGVELERSNWMVISIIAIMKAGAAYLPIDPSHPKERIDYIKEDSQCKFIVDQKLLNQFKSCSNQYSNKDSETSLVSKDLAYVIYTSGSTGNPKGVMIEHHSLVNRLEWMQKAYPLTPKDTIIQKTTYTFDVSVWELVWWSMYGAKLSLLDSGAEKDVERIIQNINENKVTVMHFVPSMMALFLDYLNEHPEQKNNLSSLKQVFTSGEALTKNLRDAFFELLPQVNLMNLYGPTEASIDVSYYDCKNERQDHIIPIGKPIDNTQLYILDKQNNLLPKGAEGTLFIAGDGLARGYLNNEELTKEKFVENPYSKGKKMYDTGDVARWLPDGNIEFIGRNDNQVKVRGFRIELGEIEYQLSSKKDIKTAVVLCKEITKGDNELIAYVVADKEQNITDIRGYLEKKMPEYMIPAYFVQLEELPLTLNGKIDRKSLPSPKGLGLATGNEYVAPKNETEEKMVSIWKEILGAEKVGMADDFFKLGGHSLKATRLVGEYHKTFSVKLGLNDVFENSTLRSQEKLISRANKVSYKGIPKVKKKDSYSLSNSQRRIWAISQFEEGLISYNIPIAITMGKDFDFQSFEKAIYAAIERHEILRTIFKSHGYDDVRQEILSVEELNFKLNYHNIRNEPDSDKYIKDYIYENDLFKPFNLEEGPLFRGNVFQTSEVEYVLYFVMHHLVTDGWSMKIISRDVWGFYEAFKTNTKPDLPKLRIQYKDYASWQQTLVGKKENEIHKQYWLKRLSGELPTLNLPSQKQRPKIQTYNGRYLQTYLSKELTQSLYSFSHKNGGSLFMTLLAAWNTLFYHYTSQEDIIMGSPVAGRDHPDLENLVGCFINTLALRNQIDSNKSFLEFYKEVKTNTLESYTHQTYPFDQLVEDLSTKRDISRSAIFDTIMVLQNTGEKIEDFELEENIINRIDDLGVRLAKFDLEINFYEIGNYIEFRIKFNTDVYEKSMIDNLIYHYKQLLSEIIINPHKKIGEIDFLTTSEKQQLAVEFNSKKVNNTEDKTIIGLFEEQVAKTPNHTAIAFEDNKFTYKQLNELSNQLAFYLKEKYTIQVNDLIGIALYQPDWFVISMLAVLKANAAYIPIDPNYPEKRKNFISKDSNAKIIINEEEIKRFVLDKHNFSIESQKISSNPNNLVYVIYTSGTTGNPKGVQITNRNLTDYFHGLFTNTNIRSCHNFGLMSTLAADLGNTVLFGSLLSGGTLHLFEKESLMSPYILQDYFEKHRIDCIKITPSHWNALTTDALLLPKKILIFGGEELTFEIINKIKKETTSIEVINHYGPTETTIGKLLHHVDLDKTYHKIPIGKVFSNSQIYILNSYDNLVPKGVKGELCIGGEGVSIGYFDKPDLTKDKFFNSPFNKQEILYRTGDLVRYLPDGEIEFFGRLDDQIKIRGNRVELKEIQNVLLQHDTIKDVAVIVASVEENKLQIIAYLVVDKHFEENNILSELKTILPDYMLPNHWIKVDKIPLTLNGKVNREMLPALNKMQKLTEEYSPPKDEMEKELVRIWEEILNKDKIGINDNFFAIGGHSLKVIQLIGKYNQRFDIKLTFRELFMSTTIISHKELIELKTWAKKNQNDLNKEKETIDF